MYMLRIMSTLAWRNLWRNHRRTIIMISAITIGVWAMIFMTALMRGMVNEMVRDGIRALPGHVQIHGRGFLDDPGINNLLPMKDEDVTASFDAAGFDAWAGRIRVPAVVTSERDSRGITLYGIDPVRERDITFVAGDIVEGRFLEDADDSGVVIGRKLADNLETELGKRIVIMSQDPDNEIADRGFRIVGIFEARLEAYETSMLFAGKSAIQKMLNVPDRINEVVVLGDDYRNVDPVVRKVTDLVGPGVEVLPWYEVDSYLGTMMTVMDGFVLVWMIVVFLALSFGLVNTLVMAVFERVREIGLMMALGMRPTSILLQIVIESLLLLLLGLLIGNVLAGATVYWLRDGIDISVVAAGMEMFGASSLLYPQLTAHDVVLANVVVLILGSIASLSPAWRASRYDPIEAITKV
ncbi:MAG: ABC transporter permease [Gammaproteobacteria bacterium]|nr:ABC transporter permease [Gammaproteobacteria bacterium]MDH4313989.1 ABC transporter permease [Gammaproteobacteria bacterium]MDH5212723.1 ABC transporter permease [Gammaproteobacteria bacterium]MDH5501047.1 ABC transporter permease [Gammaproteobacteria bacterium]